MLADCQRLEERNEPLDKPDKYGITLVIRSSAGRARDTDPRRSSYTSLRPRLTRVSFASCCNVA